MNAIVGFSEILNDSLGEESKEYTKIIVNNVDYLLSLIDNIIMVSRIDSEQINNEIENNSEDEAIQQKCLMIIFDIFKNEVDFIVLYKRGERFPHSSTSLQ